uniref:ISXO2-like transposase domain-containing protein n=1 Tax=Chromera velia CCMP2878 TaxID=1169474 RepID=A0A0G4F6Q3_9ALVE|eukprot:Cvel_15298.t1-p1 / transcript=Cvel_15298.t1 / gene=Cvel_15298 / organism=Chromera_velia_CCMP2878 / gene_product=hypothetical protein / transcript_product=hypothetical protein / location=Cvel_scaffold1123:15427-18053(-) / protein_length=351 / sequence_SO=supercontig / SO=protein_coding / is_pseudo=false
MEFSHADLILQARWWAGGKNSSITKTDLHNNSETTANWKKNFREAVAQMTVEKGWMRPGLRIGGLHTDGTRIKVYIDESLAGHVKFHRGKPTDGVWIVGAVEETKERKFFFIAVEDRSAKTLEAIIEAHIDKDSHLISDCWTRYNNVKEKGLVAEHDRVNHSEEFKDEVTGACTNHIKGTWTSMKRWIPKVRWRMGAIFDDLLKYMWRREHHTRIWDALWEACAAMEYEPVVRNREADAKRKAENAEADSLLAEKKSAVKAARTEAEEKYKTKRALQKLAAEDEEARMQMALQLEGFDGDSVEAALLTEKELMAPYEKEVKEARDRFHKAQRAYDAAVYTHREGISMEASS